MKGTVELMRHVEVGTLKVETAQPNVRGANDSHITSRGTNK